MFKPTRSERYIGETEKWEITVTPPSWAGIKNPAQVFLTESQHRRYCYWQLWGCPIQDVLPDLTAAQRECLISGIGPQEWDEFFGWDESHDQLASKIKGGGDDA